MIALTLILASLGSTVKHEPYSEVCVNELEVNTVEDPQNRPFAWARDKHQVIAWDYCWDGSFHVTGVMFDIERKPVVAGDCVVIYYRGRMWKIHFLTKCYTWSKFNRVQEDRDSWFPGNYEENIFKGK